MASRLNQMKRSAYLCSKKVKRWNKEDLVPRYVRDTRTEVCFKCEHRNKYDCWVTKQFIPHKVCVINETCPKNMEGWITII